MRKEDDIGSDAEMEPEKVAATPAKPYWCVVCGRPIFPEVREDRNYYVHDNINHPECMTFDECDRPQ